MGNDIQKYYDLKLSDESEKELKGAGITIDNNGDFIISGELVNGDYSDLTFIATPKEEYKDKYSQGQTTFRIIVKDLGEEQRFSWAVYDKTETTSVPARTTFLPRTTFTASSYLLVPA